MKWLQWEKDIYVCMCVCLYTCMCMCVCIYIKKNWKNDKPMRLFHSYQVSVLKLIGFFSGDEMLSPLV